MTEYDDYLYPNFVPNINFVAKNIKLTHELVNSIENEVQEVKVLIQQKIQRQTDFQQLLTLINQERDLLHNEIDQKYNQINHREINLNEEIETLKQEYEEKILFYQSELDRSMIECNSAMNEKTKAIEQSKELETYCLQLENEYNTQRQDLMQKNQEITQLQQENQQYKDYILQIEEELRIVKSINQSYPPYPNTNNHNYNSNSNDNNNKYDNANRNTNYNNPNDTYPKHNNSFQQINSQPLIESTQPISVYDNSQPIIPNIPKKSNITLTEVLKQHSMNPNNLQSNNSQANVNPNIQPQLQTTQTVPSSIATTTTTTSTLNQSPVQSPNHNQPQNNIDFLEIDSNQTTKIESLQKRLSFLELERETMYHPIQQMASQFEYIVPQNTESVDLSETLSPTSNQIFPYDPSFEDYRFPPQSPLQPQPTQEQDFTSKAISQLDLQSPSDSLDGDQLLLNNYTSNAFEYDDSIQLEDLLRVQV